LSNCGQICGKAAYIHDPHGYQLKGVTEADFAADLAKIIRGVAAEEYQKANKFFATTYPTPGLQNLLANVSAQLNSSTRKEQVDKPLTVP